MVRTKVDNATSGSSGSGSYRKAVAARAPKETFGSSPCPSNNSTSPRLINMPVAILYVLDQPQNGRKASGEFFGGSRTTRFPEKENRIPSEDDAGGSGTGTSQREVCPLPSDDDMDD
uniref:PCNA-associated factor n=1 Tax=Leptobrachium leishanense TaxID=445787 RepID=A0A8C5QUX4_9ANUR